ncbi:DMT family transporter [Oceanispirochaeta sp.]|jgi:drug/metabolite transporter (DMT)-like permease|uniref:DMT family transporter n=1 Tax=Oceanispirochaeta sp. TaxID=2035350 RepID=UPI00260AE693|nr:DMT family transporter [Oceanispirochaeta sp.]MDA3957532.1 DMT family transporter [Oceanispirochaeta sp.]
MNIAIYFLPVGAAFIMSMGMMMAKSVLKQTNSITFMFFRSFAGLAVALGFIPFVSLSGVPLSSLLLLLLSVILGPFSMNLLFFNGVERGDIGAQNALLQVTPAFVVLSDLLILSHRPGILSWAGLGLIVFAVLILAGFVFRGDSSPGTTPLSVFFGVSSAAVNGLNLVILSIILPDLGRPALLIAQNLANAILAAFLFFRLGGFSTLKSKEGWGRIIFLSLLNGILIRVVYFNFRLISLERLGPVVTSALLLTQVLFTLILSAFILKEKTTGPKIMGGFLIILGALAVTWGSF